MSKPETPRQTASVAADGETVRRRWAAVTELLERALSMTPFEQRVFLQSGDLDPDVVVEVEHLLSLESDASSAFPLNGWQAQGLEPVLPSGTLIDRYLLLEVIGRGGMGTVYRADRSDGVYRQQVAVKILQSGLSTDAVKRRFEKERQILAGLVHPGIARLLDGGATGEGRPFLVLEFVEGEPIDRYCEVHELSLEERLRLFLQVADSVQHAHQQLILHLDLKPSNILITATGEARLLDFGIARILEKSDTDEHAPETIQLLTPRYASPEQIRNGKLSTSSDVFSLATVLYRLLSGKFPYALEDQGLLEVSRIVCEIPARAPSAVAPPALRAALRGDLDAILLYALRKEAHHRYPSIAAFADDIRRHIASEPVLAHKASSRYRARKFLQRNRLPVAVAATIFLVLSGSLGAVFHANVVARRERAAAMRRLQDIQNLARFYVNDLFSTLNDLPGTLPVRKQMADNAVKYLKSMTEERGGDPVFSVDLANGLFEMAKIEGFPNQPSMGDLRGAQGVLNLAREMVELHARQVPNDPKTPARRGLIDASEANITNSLGDVAGAVALEQKAWDEVQPVLRGTKSNRWMQISTYCMFNSGYLASEEQFSMADPAGALMWINRGEALLLELGHDKTEFLSQPLYITQLAQVRYVKGNVLKQLNRDTEARAYLEQAMHDVDGQNSENTIEIAEHIRNAHLEFAKFLLAHGEIAKATEVSTVLRPPSEPAVAAGKGTFDLVEYGLQTRWWAILSANQGRYAEARANITKSLDATRTLIKEAPEDRTLTAQHASDLVAFAELPGVQGDQARRFFSEAIELTSTYSKDHPTVLSPQILEARAHLGLARLGQNPKDRRTEAARALALLGQVARQRMPVAETEDMRAAAQALIY